MLHKRFHPTSSDLETEFKEKLVELSDSLYPSGGRILTVGTSLLLLLAGKMLSNNRSSSLVKMRSKRTYLTTHKASTCKYTTDTHTPLHMCLHTHHYTCVYVKHLVYSVGHTCKTGACLGI